MDNPGIHPSAASDSDGNEPACMAKVNSARWLGRPCDSVNRGTAWLQNYHPKDESRLRESNAHMKLSKHLSESAR